MRDRSRGDASPVSRRSASTGTDASDAEVMVTPRRTYLEPNGRIRSSRDRNVVRKLLPHCELQPRQFPSCVTPNVH